MDERDREELVEIVRLNVELLEQQRTTRELFRSRRPEGWNPLPIVGAELRKIELETSGKRANLTLETVEHGSIDFPLDRGYWELDAGVACRMDSRSNDDANAWLCITPAEPAVLLEASVRGDDGRASKPADWLEPDRISWYPAVVQLRLVVGSKPSG